MRSKPRHIAKRTLVFLLTLSILWSETSFGSLAQTINGESTENLQEITSEEPSGEPEEEISEITEETSDPEKPEEPSENPSEEPSDVPSEEPSEETLVAPEDEEEPEFSETPSMTTDSEELELTSAPESRAGESSFSFRIDGADSAWNGETIPGGSVIRIYDNNEELDREAVEDIIWYGSWLIWDNDDYYEMGRDTTELDLSNYFNPFEIKIKVEILLSGGQKYEMMLDCVEPSPAEKSSEKLEGIALPGYELSLTGEHSFGEGDCFIIRDDDGKGTNAECVGDEKYRGLDDGDNGKYIYAKYAVWDKSGDPWSRVCYQTEPVYIGFHAGNDEDDQKANAELLQDFIDKLAKIASETGDQQWLSIPDGVRIMADTPIILYDGVTLHSEAGPDMDKDPAFTGSIQVKKYGTNAKPVGKARIENFFFTSCTKGIVIDAASDVCAVLDSCAFDINGNATFLKVSKVTYAGTEINNSIAYFRAGGTLLSMSGENDSSMPSVFKLGNTHLRVKAENSTVNMLEAPNGVKWNVDNLEPMDWDSLGKLLPGVPVNVINNVFGIDGINGMVSNSKELTVDSAAYKWISYNLAGDKGSFSDEDAKIIVEPNNDPAGKYEVTRIPVLGDAFRPYAVTGTYAVGTGNYKDLLPKGYLTYIVVDVNQKNGFPYGALVGKEIETKLPENFVVMQYHKDKSVETAASVISGEANINHNSALEDISVDENGKCRIEVNTYVRDEQAAEPIVLAVYSEVPNANTKLSVYEEDYYDDEFGNSILQVVPSDGKILTDGDKAVYFKLNEGIANNALGKDSAFEIVQTGCTVPEGQITSDVSENGAEMTLTIPEGAYGTLTVKAHYKGSASAKAADFTYTLQLTSIGNIKGVAVDYVNSGKQYYGTAAFDVLSSEAKPFLSVKSRNGEESRYNLKVISSSLSGKSVTVQYMLDLRSDEAWDSFVQNPPCLLVETVAGTWELLFEASGADKLSYDRSGVRYLFDKEDGNKAAFTGALIINGEEYYKGGTQLDIPEEVEGYTVTAMAEGCLNNIYENGIRKYAPDVVIIPKTVENIRGFLVTDKSYSNLRQIVVNDDDNTAAYCSYGTWGAFVSGIGDDVNYCALYKKNGDKTELIEIASNYEGDLSWRGDAEWTEDTYKLDFSNITGFRCDESDTFPRYEGWGEILLKIDDNFNSVTVIKAVEKMGTAAVLPEYITSINARAFEKTAVDTLVLPSTLVSWEGGLTQAKNIYVYNDDTSINPVSGIADSVKGVTFYGFTDDNGVSALKTWVTTAVKGQGYKFVAMTESSAAVDYTVNTLRSAVRSSEGIEYYEVYIGEELTETFDFDIVSKVKNGYPGKTDVVVEIESEDTTINDKTGKDVGLVTDEFKKERRDDGSIYYRAVNPGVVKVNIKKGDKLVKTVYFAVRPNYYEMMNEQPDWITLGDTQEIYVTAFKWDSEAGDNVPCTLTEEALKEYEALGVLRVVTPEGRKADGKDAWKIERKGKEDGNDDGNEDGNDDAKITYKVTPQLRRDNKGSIKGGEGSEFIFELFGDSCSVWIDPVVWESYNLIPCDDKWNPIMEKKGDTVDIPIVWKEWNTEDYGSFKYGITFDGEEYPLAACEVISGSKFVDAEIIKNNDETASLRLIAKANGKAQVRVYTPYAHSGDMVLTVSVGANLVEGFSLKLWEGTAREEKLNSSVDPADERYQFGFDLNETDDDDKYVWKNMIPISEIINSTGESLPSNKLKWTVSDSGLAELVKADKNDKNKVTGIKLKGEGTVLITATVNDTNAAAIKMLFTVRDLKPRLHNDNAALDIYKVDSKAEYTFAVPDGVTIDRVGMESVILNKKGVTVDIGSMFDCYYSGGKVFVNIRNSNNDNNDNIPAPGTYNFTFNAYAYCDAGEDEPSSRIDLDPYKYTVTLKLGGTAPKVTVTSADTIDLSVPSKRESALTVKVGDVVKDEGTEIALNTADATTDSFSQYFELKKNADGVYSVTFKDANGKTPAEVAKLFNNKKIKLTVESSDYDYRSCPKTAEVSLKITATTPALKVEGGGKVAVNTTDFTSFEYREDGYGVYTAKTSYTLTDGFELLSDANSEEGEESNDAVINMEIAAKQAAYKDMFTFRQEGDRIITMVDPGVPKGTYTFTWTPTVRAYTTEFVEIDPDENDEEPDESGEDSLRTEQRNIGDTIFKHSLKKQTISVVVTTSTAKAALSSTKLVVDRNYKYTEVETCLQFDENQIQNLYGSSYWFECNADWIIQDSITLVKAPKGVTEADSKVKYGVYDNRICVWVEDTEEDKAVAGEYKYSVTPYVMVGANVEVDEDNWEDIYVPMALAPINFSVQVTDKLPTASLAQSTVTLDNNDLSSMALVKWNIKGNYQYIVGPWSNGENGEERREYPEFKISYDNGNGPENGPEVYLEGDDIRVQAIEGTLKGTYKFTIAPQVVLDSSWIPDDEDSENGTDVRNTKMLAPVTLTVKINSTRPTVKLEKSTLTVNSSYPGEEDINEYGMFENVPAEAVTEINTSNKYAIGNIKVVPADAKTRAIQEDSAKTITFCQEINEWGHVSRFAAIPTTETPKGDYNYLVYAWLYAEDEGENGEKIPRNGAALEPVKLKVTVKNEEPTLELSSSSISLPAGREGRIDITLQGQTDLVSGIEEKTEFLVKVYENKKWIWKLADNNLGDAYAMLVTSTDGSITVTALGKSDAVSNAKVTYAQKTYLIGNTKSYDASYQLTFNLTAAAPKAVLSGSAITVNKNCSEWEQEGNQVKLTLNTGEKIVDCVVSDNNAKKDIIDIYKEEDGNGYTCAAYFEQPDKVVKGIYTFNLTPYVNDTDGNTKALSPVKLTVYVTDTLPTVSASQTKVTINKLDRRENTWQFIHLKPSIPYGEVRYDVAVTKGPKGVDLLDINFFPEGWNIEGETDLILGSVDSEIPDGAYTVTVTPYTWVNGQRKNLKSINIAVTVNAPKITAAVQAPKVTIDVATEGTVYTRNSILLTGTNADLVSKIYWDGDCKLTKKPKGAGDHEIWIEDLWPDDEYGRNGKDFAICWNHDRDSDNKYVNVTPGVYEFTLTPTGLETYEGGVNLLTPGAVKLSVTVKNSMPAVKYGKTASKMNLAFMDEDNTFIALSDTSWHLEYVDAVMTSWPKGAGEEDKSELRIDYDGRRLRVSGSEKVPEGSYTFMLEPHVKKNDIEMPLKEQKYTVTVKNEIPTAKVSSGKLTCNVLYTGNYGFEGDPEDNFNKKQQMKLTLNKNYGPSHFEDIKVAFTGKAAQQAEADKIDWRFYPDDGTVAVRLREGRVANNGSYSFEITPVIRGDLTGVKMTLKPVKITVAVENKAIKATAKASGKIDLLNRDESGITYNVTLSDKDADIIKWIDLVPPEKGNNESWKFWLEQDGENPAKCIVRANDGEELSTKVNYEMRLAVHTIFDKTYYVPVKIKPTQSKLTAKSDVTAVTLFKQASDDTAAVAEIKATINNTPSGEMLIMLSGWNGELITGNADFRVLSKEEKSSKGVKVKIQFASEQAKSKYKAGSKVTLPIYVNVYNQATDSYNTVKVNMTVNIKN